MAATPLPPQGNAWEEISAQNAARTVRRLRAIDAEIFGTLYAEAGEIDGLTITNATITNAAISSGTITNADITSGSIGSLDVDGDLTLAANVTVALATNDFTISGTGVFQILDEIPFEIEGQYTTASETGRFRWQSVGTSDDEVLKLSYEHDGILGNTADLVKFVDYNLASGFSGDDPKVILYGQLDFEQSANQYIQKTGSGDLVIRNLNTGANVTIAAHDSGGTNRNRLTIDGDGVTRLYGKSGNSALDITSTNDNVRIYNDLQLDSNTWLDAVDPASLGYTGVRLVSNGTESGVFTASGTVSRWYFQETNDYLYYDGAAELFQLIQNGNVEIYSSSSEFRVGNVYSYTPSGTANVVVDSNGRMHRSSSALKYKTQVTSDYSIADIDVVPVSYVGKGDGKVHVGLIADWLAEQDSRLGIYDGTSIEDYDTRALLAVAFAKIDRLEKRCNCV